MAGPFGAENEPLYILWVRWARYLAAHGLDVIRFDYRGVGESTGEFQQMDFGAWLSDLQLCCHRLTSDDLPLVLHGLGLGALLAARAFHEGIGDATLLWSPPPNGREILQYSLRRHTAAGYGRRTSAVVVTRQDCIRSLEAGEAVHGRWLRVVAAALAAVARLPIHRSGRRRRRGRRDLSSATQDPVPGPGRRPTVPSVGRDARAAKHRRAPQSRPHPHLPRQLRLDLPVRGCECEGSCARYCRLTYKAPR